MAISPAALELSYAGDLAVDSHGTIYFADPATNAVLVLRPDLSLQTRIGRRGAGPGEFAVISSVGILAGDSVLAYDIQLARISVFTPNTFQLARTIPLTADGGGHPMEVRASSGPVWLGLFEQSFVAGRPALSDSVRITTIRAYTPTGAPFPAAFPPARGAEAMVVRNGTMVMAGTRPFPGGCTVVVAAAAVFVVDRDSAMVDVRRPDGSLIKRLALPGQHPPIAAAERRDSIAKTPTPFHAVLDRQLPRRWPAVAGVASDRTGSIWVGLRQATGESVVWAEVLPTGTLSGRTVSLSRRLDLRYVTESRLFAVGYDEDDVPRVLALSITRR